MAEHKSLLSRAAARRFHPRLRVVADGSNAVNARRAERSGAVRVEEKAREQFDRMPPVEQALATGWRVQTKELRADDLTTLAQGVEVSVFLEVPEGTTAKTLELEQCHVRGSQATAQVSLDELARLTEAGLVRRAELGAILRTPDPLDEGTDGGPPEAPPERKIPAFSHRHRDGEGVLIGIVDVGGFDFAHPDFRDESGGTRFFRIWDQGGEGTRPAPTAPPFEYGAEFTKAHLDGAISAAPEIHVPPEEIERQSQLVPASHGTHVASIAAGNCGVCPKAMIAGVLLSLAPEDSDRRRSFYDSVRLVHAIEYLFELGRTEGFKAVSINVSLGTNGHAHDGSDATSRWIDALLLTSGRAISVAAGNAGQESPADPEDIGFVVGRIHTSGQFTHAGETHEIRFHVVGSTIEDISENELEIWTSNRDRYEVQLVPPSGPALEFVAPGGEIDNRQLEDGTFVAVYNQLFHDSNGQNLVSVYLSPFFGTDRVRGIQPGVWTVRLRAVDVRDGEYHGWLERDDPRPVIRDGPIELWSFPSFFHVSSNVDERSISSLGCGPRVVGVANLVHDEDRINITSSQGPTRDGRPKPDLAARGTRVAAARGFDPDRLWMAKTGTSMASPYVCGVAGLMLGIRPELTAAQIAAILQRTATPLGGGSSDWRNDAGYGRIDPEAALAEVTGLDGEEEAP